MSSSLFTWKDLFRSVVLGVLVGWLLVSIDDPEHKRFDFKLTKASVIQNTQTS